MKASKKEIPFNEIFSMSPMNSFYDFDSRTEYYMKWSHYLLCTLVVLGTMLGLIFTYHIRLYGFEGLIAILMVFIFKIVFIPIYSREMIE